MTDIRPIWERSHPVAIAEVERLRAALKEIANPLSAISERAKVTGDILSGTAYLIANSVPHLQSIARAALNHEQKGNENDRRSHQG